MSKEKITSPDAAGYLAAHHQLLKTIVTADDVKSWRESLNLMTDVFIQSEAANDLDDRVGVYLLSRHMGTLLDHIERFGLEQEVPRFT